MVKGIQIVGILVSLYLVGQTILNYRRKNYGLKRSLFFGGLWMLVAFLFVYPPVVQMVLPILTTQDMVMSVLVVGLVLVFVLVSELYQQVGQLERRFAELVQNLAIHDYFGEVSGGNGDNEDEQ